jgi:hypothetical protein
MVFNTPPKIDGKKYSTVSAMVIFKNLPFMIFIFGLGLVYIANVQYAEYQIRKSQVLEKEIKELKWKYWSLQSGIMYNSTEGQVSKKVSEKELIMKEEAPKKLIQLDK